MAYSRTLSELEQAVRREADMVNSTFVTSDEVTAYINQSWAELYDRIVLFDQEYLLRTVDITSTGAGVYDILNDGKTGLVRSLVFLTPQGSGYVVGDLIDLTQAAAATKARIKVDSINGSGAVVTFSLVSAGNGYVSDSLSVSTAAVTFTPVPLFSSGTGGAGVVYLDSDFYKCKGVWFGTANTNGFWSPLRRFTWDEQNVLRQSAIYEASNSLPLYRVYTVDNREKLSIAPDTLSGVYRLYYYPAPQKMLASTDRIDGRSGWDEWVVKDSAIKCLLKEESTDQAAAIKVIRDELFKRFELHAADRDGAQPERIRDHTLLSRRYGPWR
jgi:hypothetical protein